MTYSIRDLRRHAVSSSLFPATTLGRAMKSLGFVQADPIRSPARSQDLILRHRVQNYQVGDLDRSYGRLKLEEDFLYAYGFMPLSTWQLLHPRRAADLSATDQKVLAVVSGKKQLHPRDLQRVFGAERELNDWGGYSKATTRSLEKLHYRGLIRVVGRQGGLKLYQRVASSHQPQAHDDRLRGLIMLIAKILAPISMKSLRAALGHLGHAAPDLSGRNAILLGMLRSGELRSEEIDGQRYVWPAGKMMRKEPQEAVRFLAPFDPLVWDRRRFEHLWGWAYRFEAYTPPAKRKLGYYALPLLWREVVIGWVNVMNKGGVCELASGFVGGSAPADSAFRQAYEIEWEQLRFFLKGRPGEAPKAGAG